MRVYREHTPTQYHSQYVRCRCSRVVSLPRDKPKKPHAFIVGHGIWNSLNETATGLWFDTVEGAINGSDIWLTQEKESYPRLFITPSAAGDNKPMQCQGTQGSVALHRFEIDLGLYPRNRGIDHLGMYNATIQNTTPDGTHAGMRAHLLKATFGLKRLNGSTSSTLASIESRQRFDVTGVFS